MPTVGLVVPAQTYRADAFLRAASALALDIVTISDAPQALANIMGEHFLRVAFSDPVAAGMTIAAHNEKIALDAIVAVDDGGALCAVEAAGLLGLIHNDTEAIAITRNKAKMRTRLAEVGINQPDFRIVSPLDAASIARAVGDAADALGYPVVVKPVGLSGSRGVIRADERDAAESAAVRAQAIALAAGEDAAAPLLVESFVEGDEVAFEGRLRHGVLEALAVFDKPDPLTGPYFEETIYVTPSGLDDALLGALEATVGAACAAIGLSEGPIHAEARITPNGDGAARVVFLEVAARTIGGRCAQAIRLANGTSLEAVVLADALGLDIGPIARETEASGVLMVPIPRAGRLLGVRHVEEASAVAGVTGIEITIPPGRIVRPAPEGDRYLGFVFARAPSAGAVVDALRKAQATLDVEIVPDTADRDVPANDGAEQMEVRP